MGEKTDSTAKVDIAIGNIPDCTLELDNNRHTGRMALEMANALADLLKSRTAAIVIEPGMNCVLYGAE